MMMAVPALRQPSRLIRNLENNARCSAVLRIVQSEQLLACARAHRDAVGDRVADQIIQ
jgi:hypothetical protein